MTVGITLTNDVEAYVIVDTLLSNGSNARESATAEKMTEILNADYKGVLHGAGDGEIVVGLHKLVKKITEGYKIILDENEKDLDEEDNLENILNSNEKEEEIEEIEENNKEANSLKELVIEIHEGLKQIIRDKIDEKTKTKIEDIYMQSSHLMEDLREEYIAKATVDVLENQTEKLKEASELTTLRLVAYDKKYNGIRTFDINYDRYEEVSLIFPIGSGNDGADFYYSEHIQGKNLKTAPKEELIWHGINMYHSATINMGVGGTPKIAYISDEGIELFDRKKICYLCNLVGAYKSELSTKTKIFSLFKKVLNNGKPYKKINNLLKPENIFGSMCISYQTWQEKANNEKPFKY